MKVSGSAPQLAEMIKQAMLDCELTTTEYDEILALANADGIIDAQEQALLRQLQDLLANGAIKRVKG